MTATCGTHGGYFANYNISVIVLYVGIGNTSHSFSTHRIVQEVRKKISRVTCSFGIVNLSVCCLILCWLFGLIRLKEMCTMRQNILSLLLSATLIWFVMWRGFIRVGFDVIVDF